MDMSTHVNMLVSLSFFQLRCVQAIRRSILISTAIQLINGFVISRIDCCNSLHAGLPACQHSVYSELCSQNYLRQKEVRPRDAISEGQTSLVACSSEGEVQMLLVDIQGTARTGANIHSTIQHQRHGGSAALNTSPGNTQPSHLAQINNKVWKSFFFGCWPHGMELAARQY